MTPAVPQPPSLAAMATDERPAGPYGRRIGPRRFGVGNWRGLATLFARGVRRHASFWLEMIAGPCVYALLFLVVFVLARSVLLGPVWPGVDFASFIAAGLIGFSFCHAAFVSLGGYLVHDKLEGVIQDLLVAPLSALELVLGLVGGAAVAGLMTGVAVLLSVLPFVSWPTLDVAQLLLFSLLGAIFFALVGLLVGLWARKWDHYTAAETFIMLPLGLLSGTFFLRADLPPLGGELLMFNPVFHIIDGFRGALLGRNDGDPLLGSIILILLIVLLGLVGWRLVVRGWHLKQ